jgi:hypothetical protein
VEGGNFIPTGGSQVSSCLRPRNGLVLLLQVKLLLGYLPTVRTNDHEWVTQRRNKPLEKEQGQGPLGLYEREGGTLCPEGVLSSVNDQREDGTL